MSVRSIWPYFILPILALTQILMMQFWFSYCQWTSEKLIYEKTLEVYAFMFENNLVLVCLPLRFISISGVNFLSKGTPKFLNFVIRGIFAASYGNVIIKKIFSFMNINLAFGLPHRPNKYVSTSRSWLLLMLFNRTLLLSSKYLKLL